MEDLIAPWPDEDGVFHEDDTFLEAIDIAARLPHRTERAGTGHEMTGEPAEAVMATSLWSARRGGHSDKLG